MRKWPMERPALFVSELGLLLLGLLLTLIGFANFVAAFTADRRALVGAFIFFLAGAWCLSVSLVALLGHPVQPSEGLHWWRLGGLVRPIL